VALFAVAFTAVGAQAQVVDGGARGRELKDDQT